MARTRTKAPGKGSAGSRTNPPPRVSLRDAKDVLSDGGVTPLDVMIGTMRALWQEAHTGADPAGAPLVPTPQAVNTVDGPHNEGGERPDMALRDKALAIAEKVAPYIHPRAKSGESPVSVTPPQPLAIEIVFVKPDGVEPSG